MESAPRVADLTPGAAKLSSLRQAVRPPGYRPLSEEERREVEELTTRDRAVRAHERAHLAVAGGLAGGARYEYEMGPDGRRYVVGGEVHIDVSAVRGRPEETIRKMEQVRQAALAPADPSGQDRQVAAEAARIAQQARAELREQGAAASHGGAEPCGSCGLARYAGPPPGSVPDPPAVDAAG